jgi:hypothetical protein
MYGKDYMSNSISLINDANEIRTEIMKTSKTNIETLRNLRRSVTFKNIRDWFYQKEQETDSLGDEEFDPGLTPNPMTNSHLLNLLALKIWIVSAVVRYPQCIRLLHIRMNR